MRFLNSNIGYDPRPYPLDAIWPAIMAFLIVGAAMTAIGAFCLPVKFDGVSHNALGVWQQYNPTSVLRYLTPRLTICATTGFVAGLVAFLTARKLTPLTEPFTQVSDADPRVYYGENARNDLQARLFKEAGKSSDRGLYLAPHLVLPRSTETKNILSLGEPNSGKTNLIRAWTDQVVERGDRVLLLCNKGDVTASFASSEATLIAAHHKDSYALDLATDIDDTGAALQFAKDIVPESNPKFWSDCASVVLADIIVHLQVSRPGAWTAGDVLSAALEDSDEIRQRVAIVALNAGPLIQGNDPEGDDRTVQGILTTMRSAAFANLRPLAWAWDDAPKERRFSIKRWLSDSYRGPRTVIVQYAVEYGAISTLVAGSLMQRIAARLADPSLPNDPRRRVVFVLDEFHLLGKIEGFASALAVGREKGLVAILGIQSISQIFDKYGETGANAILDLFRIKVFGRLSPGTSTAWVEKQLGDRAVSALVQNRTPGKDDARRYVEERKRIPAFSATRLASKLGVFENDRRTGDVRAVVQCYGQCYVLDWPFTTWRKKRKGFVAAPWLKRPPTQ